MELKDFYRVIRQIPINKGMPNLVEKYLDLTMGRFLLFGLIFKLQLQ